MEQNISSSRKKTFPTWLIAVIVGCLVWALACYGVFRFFFPAPTRAPEQFPMTDIVYYAGDKLGFINADGSSATSIPFYFPHMVDLAGIWDQPVITGDNKTLLFTHSLYPVGIENVFMVYEGEYAVECKQWGFVQLAADQQHVFVETENGLAKYLPEDCGTNNPPAKMYKGIFGVLSPDEQYLADVKLSDTNPFTYDSSLAIRQLNGENERIIGPGDFPAWSKDGKWLAYTGPDGIYILHIGDDMEPRRIVAHQNPDPSGKRLLYHLNPGPLPYFPPAVSWSPDGQWLVYHIYRQDLGRDEKGDPKYYSIFKVNVLTGKEIRLIDGGISPYWRWPTKP